MILIIAYGNSLRSDDGAGLLLAEQLEQECLIRHIPVERIAGQQLLPELSAEIARADVSAVLFVDTRASLQQELKPDIQIQPVSVEPISSALGHHLKPAALLLYALLLYGRQPPAWIVTVPGVEFGHGQGLSETAQQAVQLAKAPLTALLDQIESNL